MSRFFLVILLSISLSASVVKDVDTDLVWQDNNDAQTLAMSYEDAVNYCKKLNIGGYSKWRLPNIDELVSITDKGKTNPSLKSIFKHIQASYYWSISKTKWSPSIAWIVNFNDGDDSYSLLSDKNYVRCVR